MALFESSTWEWDGVVRSVYGDAFWYAQTFTPQTTHDITSVILALGRPTGDTPGTVTVTIREVEDEGPNIGKPKFGTDYDLCSGTTNGNTVNELTGLEDDPTEREITFGTNPTLTADVKYAIVVRAPSGTAFNKLYWLAATTSTYADGDQCHSDDAGEATWTLYDDRELWFKEYGTDVTPAKPTAPSPSDTGTNVTLDESELSWTAGARTDTFDIYFGVSGSEALVESDQAVGDTNWAIEFGTLDYGTTYGWRVDATNVYATTTGDTWTFTTISFAPPTSSPSEGEWQVIKRLVAAAADTFWIEDI